MDDKGLGQEHASWLIDARKKNQDLLLRLYGIAQEHHEALKRDTRRQERELFLYLVGSGFSLWRGGFLSDNKRTSESMILDAKKLLHKIIEDNTVTFGNERERRDWMGGYYLNNAMFRLHEARKLLQNLKPNTQSDSALIELDRLKDDTAVTNSPSRRVWDISNNALDVMSSCLKDGLVRSVEIGEPFSERPHGK